MLVWREH
jgi:hypothetical protein